MLKIKNNFEFSLAELGEKLDLKVFGNGSRKIYIQHNGREEAFYLIGGRGRDAGGRACCGTGTDTLCRARNRAGRTGLV